MEGVEVTKPLCSCGGCKGVAAGCPEGAALRACREMAGWFIDAVDVIVLRHQFPSVCRLGARLLSPENWA